MDCSVLLRNKSFLISARALPAARCFVLPCSLSLTRTMRFFRRAIMIYTPYQIVAEHHNLLMMS